MGEDRRAAPERLGAYGLRIAGLEGASRWLVPQAADAARLEVETAIVPLDESPHELDEHSANLRLLGGGRLRMRREERVARYSLPAEVSDAELLHPYLTAACALVWQWSGREALHAGAFTLGGGAVLLLGGKGLGKSSTLAWLAGERGAAVLSDDLAIIENGRVLVGPRCIDTRPSGGAAPDAPGSEVVRGRERLRVALPEAAGPIPVRASVVLRWGDALSIASVPAGERLALIAPQRMFPPLAGDPETLLELVALPTVALTRPRNVEQLPAGVEALLGYLA
ncbi:MAG TPA: hypothetical protein VG294_09335 [Solirubrobacteraceae bacterium]|nr:hypothetical protein [Solirubrobacteraceae bacterium]